MKIKKGFTLIEIIVVISLMAIIGVGSFIGIRLVDKKLTLDKLNRITDKVLNAASVYFETNKVAYNEIYNKKSAAIMTLKALEDEGLLNLDNSNLTDEEKEKNYVIQFLGKETENCTNLNEIITSWSSSTPIYICTDSSGGINIKTVNKAEYNNRMYGANEPFYFRGSLVSNYAMIEGNNTLYRMVGINTDDGIELYYGAFNHNFNLSSNQYYAGSIKTTSYTNRYGQLTQASSVIAYSFGCSNSVLSVGCDSTKCTASNYCVCDKNKSNIIEKTSICESNNNAGGASTDSYSTFYQFSSRFSFNSWVGAGSFYINNGQYSNAYGEIGLTNYTTISLNPCMQIYEGSGTEYDPYKIKPHNCP